MARADSSLPSSLTDLAVLGKLWVEYAPKLLTMVRRRIDPTLAVDYTRPENNKNLFHNNK